MTASGSGAGPAKRLLVVEDEPFVAVSLVDALRELGFDVAACVADVGSAIAVISSQRLDGAVLDVNIGSQRIDPVADLLAARACPFIFTTGFDKAELPSAHANRDILQKPFGTAELACILRRVFGDPDD